MATLGHHFEEGGWGMYPIVLCALILVAITLERIAFFGHWRGAPDELLHEIGWALRRGDAKRALAIAMDGEGPAARIARAALLHWTMPLPIIESAIEAQVREEIAPFRRRLPALRGLAALATLTGLLGMVTGLVQGSGCANADATSRATMLARGISEAMNCTALGLFVSLCAIAATVAVRGAAERAAEELSADAQALRNVIAEHRRQLRWDGLRAPIERATYRANG